MTLLTSTKVRANVRNDGAIGVFESRTFEFMLDASQSEDKQVREAIRILRQIGYETRGVELVKS